MFICVCNAITDRQVRQCAELGVTSLEALRETLSVATCCGRCETAVRELLQECGGERPLALDSA
jgi:bacterioferritin-associated ferredoxin